MKRTILVKILIIFIGLPVISFAANDDNFEDGTIDSNLWVTNGRIGGVGGYGSGSWQNSFNEVIGSDGYLEARTWGPATGNTYWGESSVRTAYNYNDGNSWLINFTWETTVANSPHWDFFGVQITDGSFPTGPNQLYGWLGTDIPPGTKNLWYTGVHMGTPEGLQAPQAPFGKSDWSILINPNGIAYFYQTADASGSAASQVTLDTTKDWYFRLINVDGTSSGFSAGDNTFRLYNYSSTIAPEPLSSTLFLVGGATLGFRQWKKKKPIKS